ncbi:MAG: type 2 isopentenyl-diphosphate Delta-isomerase [Lewinellaceae bacterium]|nr:type 2 isopentenyl-diphosphate Delta-isomerase [Lewinellaceae bacterium]
MASDPTQLQPAVFPGLPEEDPSAVSRKQDHIELAFKSRVEAAELDSRFFYEPLLTAHPQPGSLPPFPFLGKILRTPIWVSSMTGGTALAGTINQNLARACAEFGMGMGLGSCRQLLYSDEHLADFDVRDTIGTGLPLFANLGIAQIEQLFEKNEPERIDALLKKLRADGLIVHVNPLQEAMQPEGDVFFRPPLDTIRQLLQYLDIKVIVKEVGQGFGPESIRALLQLPLEAIEFAAAGGTNFAKLELLRSDPVKQLIFEKIAAVGHTAEEMTGWLNTAVRELGPELRVKNVIISGGVRDFLDGYFLLKTTALPAVYGQASGFLKYARGDYAQLQTFVETQVRGLELAYAFLKVK